MAWAMRGRAPIGGARRGLIAAAVCVMSAASAWYGCAIYDTSLLLPAQDGGDGSAGDGGGDAQGDGGCVPAHPPARPTTEDGTQDVAFVVALHTISFGSSPDAGPVSSIGYDLDGVCTCPGPPSCKSNVAKELHCDDDAGRDNSGGQLLQSLALVSGGALSEATLNNNLTNGTYGLVVHVEHYNGGMNDPQVVVSIYVSAGTPPVPDGGKDHVMPVWDGNDPWTLDSASVLGGADAGRVIPNFADTNAYVANGVLVAAVDFPLTLGSSGLVTLDFVGGFVTAHVTPSGGSYALSDGLLAGRWPTQRLLGTITTLSLAGQPVCQGTQTYRDVKSRICAAADIGADPTADAAANCNALSMGIQFSADPAKMGDVVARPPGVSNCPDAGPDDCF